MALGADGGNDKLLITLAVFDLDKEDMEVAGYQSGGTRRALVIAAGDSVDENRANLDTIFNHLKIHELSPELDVVLATDQKCANLLLGEEIKYTFFIYHKS